MIRVYGRSSLGTLLGTQKNLMKRVEETLINRGSKNRQVCDSNGVFFSPIYLSLESFERDVSDARLHVYSNTKNKDGSWNVWAEDSIRNNLSFFKLIEAETEMARKKHDSQSGHGYGFSDLSRAEADQLEKFGILEKCRGYTSSTLDEMLKGDCLILGEGSQKTPWYKRILHPKG